jgi:glycosyltransferase involved in cell wall biosynthesis
MITRALFIFEKHLGHRTYYENTRRFIELDDSIVPFWHEVTYWQDGGAVERLPLLLPAAVKSRMRGVVQVRRAFRTPADVALFNTHVPATFALDWLGRIPCVVATDITPLQYDAFAEGYGRRPVRPGVFKQLKHRVHTATFRRAAHIVTWSEWVARSIVGDYGIAADKVTVIPPGIDLEGWPQARPGADPARVRLLFVGGDFARKGGEALLQAFRTVRTRHTELHVVTRDRVPDEPGLHVHHGLSPNDAKLMQLFGDSDIFVLPTLAEAFGIAAVEAMAAGLPVIASATGALAEIVTAESGVLVPPGDADALAQAMRRLIDDAAACTDMGQAGRRRAAALFDARRNVARMSALLHRVHASRLTGWPGATGGGR